MAREELKRLALSLITNRNFQAGAGGALAVSVTWYLLAPGFFLGFISGCVTLVAVQAAGLAYLWLLIKPKPKPVPRDKDVVGRDWDGFSGQAVNNLLQAVPASTDFLEAPELAGLMWVSTRPCEREDDPSLGHGKLRKNVRGFQAHGRCARLDGWKLVLTSHSGRSEVIALIGCEVKAFSETESYKKKWGRKFPVRISHPTRELWLQSREVFIYFPDGWQKELWTGVLRKTIRMAAAGSVDDPGWQSKMRPEFFSYRKKVHLMYPDLLSVISAVAMEPKADGMEAKELPGGTSRLRWRRRIRGPGGTKGAPEKYADDWELPGSASTSTYKSSSGPMDRSAVALPLAPELDPGFRGKVKGLFMPKRASPNELAKTTSVDAGLDVSDLLGKVKELDTPMLLEDANAGTGTKLTEKKSANAGEKHLDQSCGPEGGGLREGGAQTGPGPPARPGNLRAEERQGKESSTNIDVSRSPSISTEHPQMESAVCAINFLIARLFFDLEYQKTINTRMVAKIDEKLGLILTPAAIGQLSCSKFEFGSSPPLLKSIRPSTVASGVPDGFYALDVEVVYQGKVTFTIETRLDLKDSPFLMGDGDGSLLEEGACLEGVALSAGIEVGEGSSYALPRRQSSAEENPSGTSSTPGAEGGGLDLDGGPSMRGGDSTVSGSTSAEGGMEQHEEESPVQDPASSPKSKIPHLASLKDAKFPGNSSTGSNSSGTGAGLSGKKRQGRVTRGFRDMLANMASGLSQVPLSINVNITAVKGTLRVRVPPPPSDRLWLGFIDKPDLSLSFTPSIGEKELKRFPLAAKIVDKVKELINRTLVSPACVDIPLFFMRADPDDWLPRDPRMLSWRPAVVPPYGRGVSDAVPTSASEAPSESTKTVGDFEIGWEDESRQESIASGGSSSYSSRSVKTDAAAPLESGGMIPTSSWRGPFAPKDPAAPNRSILAAAKTSLETATNFVKLPQSQSPAAPPPQDQTPSTEVGASPTTSTLGTMDSMKAEVRKAATGLFKGRKEQSGAQLAAGNASKSLPPVPTVIESVGAHSEESMGSSRPRSEDWTRNESLPAIIVSGPHEGALERISENQESRVRRSSSARELDGLDTEWDSTSSAGHVPVPGESPRTAETAGFEFPLASGSSREWHGTDALKGDISGFGTHASDPFEEHRSTRLDATPLDPQVDSGAETIKEWHGGKSGALVKRMEMPLVAVGPKEIVSVAQVERPDSVEERRGMFGLRKDLSESMRMRAQDMAGKLSDREMHVQARQVVGQVMGETKEKAKEKVKKFTNFFKEKQATLAGRQAPEAES